MAKILISYYSDYGEAMYDAICDILKKNGNDIFRMNINTSEVQMTHWGGTSKIIDKKLIKEIEKFNPELIFSFNNCLPQNCYDLLSKNCKICVLDADAPDVAFWNKDIVKNNFEKYIWLGLQSYSKTMYERDLNEKLETNKNYMYFPPATVVKNEKLKIEKNI